MQANDLGEIKPLRGRWTWPHAEMSAGEYFRVSQFARPKGQVANMSYVRGNQLGKRFSVGDDPDYPGFTRVTCTSDDPFTVAEQMRQERLHSGRTHFSFHEAMEQIIKRSYAPGDASLIGRMMWGSLIYSGEEDREAVELIAEPPIRAFTVDSHGDVVVLVELKDDEIVMTGQPRNFTIEAWRKSKLLDD